MIVSLDLGSQSLQGAQYLWMIDEADDYASSTVPKILSPASPSPGRI